MWEHPRAPRPEAGAVWPAPEGVRARTFTFQNGEYLVLSYAVPALMAPRGLTAAEWAVAQAAARGRTNSEIARERGTSVRTVANQLVSLYRKLSVGSRAELVRALIADERRGP
jgi:DNA-binding NarL/FixJ family response regulator